MTERRSNDFLALQARLPRALGSIVLPAVGHKPELPLVPSARAAPLFRTAAVALRFPSS
jgi:hypothetical protein